MIELSRIRMIMQVPFVDFSWQHEPIQREIDQAIAKVVQRGDFILGQTVTQFEQAFAQASGVEYGVGVGCGTDAIALGLQACGIGPGDEVIVPVNTFIATVIGVLRTGAKPLFVDCDPATALIDLEQVHSVVTAQTKALIAVHLYGQMVSPQQLREFTSAHSLLLFEDAAQAHLAQRDGYKAGSLGVAAGYSFYPSKNLGGFGDGGIVLTNDPTLAQKVRCYRNYGASQKYVHTELGTNSRLDSLQAAVLEVKLAHLQEWNLARNQAAAQYDEALKPLADYGIFPFRNDGSTGHIYHLYVIRVTSESPVTRDNLQKALGERGIQTGIHYPIPCHLQPAYQHLGYHTGDFPHAETLAQEILSLPMFPGLSAAQVQQVVETIKSVIQGD